MEKNPWRGRTKAGNADRPDFEKVRDRFPVVLWESAEGEVAAAASAAVWKLAWKNIRPATANNGFVRDYADTAFNGCLFLWDSVFITMFWRYGRRVWDAMGTLENLYAKQHPDGFISREISGEDGSDHFPRHDPSGTGPDVLGWAEWEHYVATGDRDRLAMVFPVLAGFTRWMRRNRTWPDGSYWASGWSSGMDDQPRRSDSFLGMPPVTEDGFHVNFDHGHMTWVDTCFQALLANRILVRMARELGMTGEAREFAEEARQISRWSFRFLWNDKTNFFHDRLRDGSLAGHIKSVGAYWALLAGGLRGKKRESFLTHLSDPRAFYRPHPVPSLSADSEGYLPEGGYWCGAVWAPTTAMVLRGLELAGRGALAHDLARRHVANVCACHARTGTFFENYAPEIPAEGRHRADFVGWTGMTPTSILFEHVFGLRPDARTGRLIWDVRLTEGHGVKNYPFAGEAILDLYCPPRRSPEEKPKPVIQSQTAGAGNGVVIEIRWAQGRRIMRAGG